jgi:hypothetical protein
VHRCRRPRDRRRGGVAHPDAPRILASQVVDRIPGLLVRAPAHALAMPEFPYQYKSHAVTRYAFRNTRFQVSADISSARPPADSGSRRHS